MDSAADLVKKDLDVLYQKLSSVSLPPELADKAKSMVDRLADPLTHMVRNAMDHGLETESVRIAVGKAPQGTLSFNSYHETGCIVIEVSDDGAGINLEKVRKRAIERG